MNNLQLKKIISDTQSDPYIKWNNPSQADWCRVNPEFSVYLFNKDGKHVTFLFFTIFHLISKEILLNLAIVRDLVFYQSMMHFILRVNFIH